jgi:hypothetical protein
MAVRKCMSSSLLHDGSDADCVLDQACLLDPIISAINQQPNYWSYSRICVQSQSRARQSCWKATNGKRLRYVMEISATVCHGLTEYVTLPSAILRKVKLRRTPANMHRL